MWCYLNASISGKLLRVLQMDGGYRQLFTWKVVTNQLNGKGKFSTFSSSYLVLLDKSSNGLFDMTYIRLQNLCFQRTLGFADSTIYVDLNMILPPGQAQITLCVGFVESRCAESTHAI